MISSLTYNHLVLAASPPLLPCQGMALTLNIIITIIITIISINNTFIVIVVTLVGIFISD